MTDPKKPCDLCALPVGVKPFTLADRKSVV